MDISSSWQLAHRQGVEDSRSKRARGGADGQPGGHCCRTAVTEAGQDRGNEQSEHPDERHIGATESGGADPLGPTR